MPNRLFNGGHCAKHNIRALQRSTTVLAPFMHISKAPVAPELPETHGAPETGDRPRLPTAVPPVGRHGNVQQGFACRNRDAARSLDAGSRLRRDGEARSSAERSVIGVFRCACCAQCRKRGAADKKAISMKGREMDVPDPEQRRAANAALMDSIEEVCRHYAPSGARVEDCWEVREAGDRVALRVFLAGPMRGSWTEAETGARGDALDLVALLLGLDAAGSLAEAEQFLDTNDAEPEPKAGDGGGQMGLFGALPESRKRKRPPRRSGRGRNAGPSRRAVPPHEPPADGPAVRPGDEATGAGDATGRSQGSPDAPGGRKEAPPPSEPAQDAGPDGHRPGQPETSPDGLGFTADDRQRLRKAAEDAAWLRSRHTIRSLDAEAHGQARTRGERHGRRWRRAAEAASVLALAAVWLALGVAVETLYGVSELVAAYGVELARDVRVLPGSDGG